ncbi:MAG: fibronectin type III domain-containing protein [Ruminococcus flavefaciens]|nr:fibronectin type III domain-containing protein [Ruminococcus flavefaciens]
MKRKVSKGLLSIMAFMLLTLGFSVTTLQTKAYYEKVSSITQTDATYDSVTVQWGAAPGAAGYKIYLNDLLSSQPIATVDAATLSYTVTGLGENTEVTVWIEPYALKADGVTIEEGSASCAYAKTLSHITNLSYYVSYSTYGFEYSKSPYQGLKVQWSRIDNCDGYQAVLYKKNGKVAQTLNLSGRTANGQWGDVNFTKATRKQVYYVQVRSYVTLDGSTKYGDWSSKLYCVPDAIVTTTNDDVHQYSVKMKWKKVAGASSYSIYVSTNSKKRGKKVATVKGNKTSYTVKKVGKSKVNTLNKTYYITMVTNARFGKSTKKSIGYKVSAKTSYRYY